MRRLSALSSLTRPAWLVNQMWVMTPGPLSTGNSNTWPGLSTVISRFASFQLGCSLLEMRRLRPTKGVATAPKGPVKTGGRIVWDEAEVAEGIGASESIHTASFI